MCVAFLEYIVLRFALSALLVTLDCHTHSQKNVTYNIALKSTTYVKRNVTLCVTLPQRNITFVRFAPRATPAQRTGAGKTPTTVFTYIV